MSEIIISTDSVKDDFKNNYLNIENNSRIFFSGKFGLGKTYFLNDFFNLNKDDYEVFHLYPVSYQVNSNENIIELIKYDILTELLKKKSDVFETNEINGIKESSLLFYSWIKENYSTNQFLQSVISTSESFSELSPNPIINSLGKIGKSLKDVLDIDKKFQEFKKEYVEGEKGLIEKYINEIKSKNISETDYISYLLKEKIIKLKGDKKSVLILDDLDRIDPEHIFRILNIMSAYFEKEHENKFGFDLIIIVADYSNIREIFFHKYGRKADFAGYIDKFFTITPYYFDNKKAILDRVDEIVKSIKSEDPALQNAIGESGYIKLFLAHIFTKVVNSEIINLRELLKATKIQLPELRKGGYYESPFEDNFKQIFDKAIKIAILSFSNTDHFLEKIEIIRKVKGQTQNRMPFIKYIITMFTSIEPKFMESNSSSIIWHNFTFTKTQGGYNSISIEKDYEEDIFYELLVEYIKNKKYLKRSEF